MSSTSYSIVEYYAEQERYKCGYCKSPDTNFSHGMWAHSLTVQDYQNLIDRGWRRSGCYCYKPTMNQTCCPMYTIKCEALDFHLSKSQRKILKKMTKFLKDELKKDNESKPKKPENLGARGMEPLVCPQRFKLLQDQSSEVKTVDIEFESSKKSDVKTKPKDSTKATREKDTSSSSQVLRESREKANDSENSLFKKARLLRIERKKNKLLAQGKTREEIEAMFEEHRKKNSGKTLEDYFDEISMESSRLQNKIVRVMSDEFLSTLNESSSLYEKYQMSVHESTASECDPKTFFNFLVRSPLQWSSEKNLPKGYGSFHDQYWLDGKLIAIAVIDILPTCISSVYFFYDPAYSSLSLGTFSSLREMYLTRQFSKVVPNLKFYYMGFYIHTCPKMQYKAHMKPSKLLCPETYDWCDIEKCVLKLDKRKYSRLNEDIDAVDPNGFVDIQQVLVLYRRRTMSYRVYKERASAEDEDEVKEYATFVGNECAQRMLLYRD